MIVVRIAPRARRLRSHILALALAVVAGAPACGGEVDPAGAEALDEARGDAIRARTPPSATAVGTFSIAHVTSSGSGCPQGSVAANLADDGGAFTLIFSELFASAGPREGEALRAGAGSEAGSPELTSTGSSSIASRDARRTCRVAFDLDAPEGWSFALAETDARGYVQLDEGVVATLTLTRPGHGDGRAGPASTTTRFEGPADDDYLISARMEPADLRWSRCRGRAAVKLETSVRVSNAANPDGIGLLTADSLDGTLVGETHHIRWRRCGL